MKSNAAKILALLLMCLTAEAADISFNLQDFQTGPIGTKRVAIFPLMTPTVSGPAVITSDRISYTTAADGTFTATNMVPGTYRVEVMGPYGTTIFYIVTGSTNANAIDLTTAVTNLASGFTAYSTAQSDNLYARKTNGTAYGMRFPSGAVSNYVWTCTNATTGQGAWVAASGGSSTNGGTVTSIAVTSSTLTITGSPITTSGTININIPSTYATTSYVASATNGFVRQDVTNGLASIGYVNTATNGFVYSSITNGLLATNGIQAGSNVSIAYDEQNRPVISATGGGGSVDTNQFLQINGTNVGGYSLSLTNADSTFHLYSLLTDTSNYRRFSVKKSGNDFVMGSEAAGAGVGNGALTFMTGGTNRWIIDKNGSLINSANLLYDIGTSANIVRGAYIYNINVGAGGLITPISGTITYQGGSAGPVIDSTRLVGTESANIGWFARTYAKSASKGRINLIDWTSSYGTNFFALTFGSEDSTHVSINTTNNTLKITTGSDLRAINPVVVFDPVGFTNLLAGKTTIGTNPATATVFNPSGSGTNLINGLTTISNLVELTVSGSRGKSVTNTWYSKDVSGLLTITNLQIFKEGVLTSWKTNGVEL